jgi:hypothetical protein
MRTTTQRASEHLLRLRFSQLAAAAAVDPAAADFDERLAVGSNFRADGCCITVRFFVGT